MLVPPQRRPQNPSPFPLISHQMHPPTFQFFNFSTLLKCKLITNEFIITITPNAPASFSIIQKCKSHQMQINHKNASQSQIIIITPAFPKTDHKWNHHHHHTKCIYQLLDFSQTHLTPNATTSFSILQKCKSITKMLVNAITNEKEIFRRYKRTFWFSDRN